MDLLESNIEISNIEDFPSIDEIRNVKRGENLKIHLKNSAQKYQQERGEYLSKNLSNFIIVIHRNGTELSIKRLISPEEVSDHQEFFEQCAQAYGLLGEKLINEFIALNNITDFNGFPLSKLNGYSGNKNHKPKGKMGEWNYFFHGYHCFFENRKTKQEIEVPLTYGEEYGELDPYFFSRFIKTSNSFKTFPVDIYDEYNEGVIILKTMYELGKFEMINSNLPNNTGFIVKKRKKKKVKVSDIGIKSILLEQEKIKLPFWKKILKR